LEFFNALLYIIYNEEKSTWSNFNYLHDDTWTNENLTRGTWNDIFIKMLIATAIMII
jgi:hypothetical protein